MKKEIINIKGIKHPNSSFSHIVKAGQFLFLTSQLSVNLKTGKIFRGTIKQQTRRALENIRFLLECCDASLEDVVKVVIYIKDMKELDKMDQVYREFFRAYRKPARVIIQALSPIDGIEVEIEAIAMAPEPK